MSYTVKELSRLSGVSVRTLHWYDELGLLPPAYHTTNGYRHYEEEQLLLLQQILFFRELGFSLKEIAKVVKSDDFNTIAALNLHKQTLQKSLSRTKKLIRTIDKTILHLQDKLAMEDEELYRGFDRSKQHSYEAYLADRFEGNTEAMNLFTESKEKTKDWTKEQWDEVHQRWDELHKEFVVLIEQGLSADSKEVQLLVVKHYETVKQFYNPTKEVYIGLGDMYCENEEFRKYYDSYHMELAEYLAKAMKVFAEQKL